MRKAAEELKEWIPSILQSVELWVSSQDISTGSRAMSVLAEELENTKIGIICVSKRTQHAPWINFEAGALSKSLSEGRVIPFLVDLTAADLDGPLKQFQGVDAANKTQVRMMLEAINSAASEPIKTEILEKRLNAFWGELCESISTINEEAQHESSAENEEDRPRPEREMLAECLILLREHQKTADILHAKIEKLEGALNSSARDIYYNIQQESRGVSPFIANLYATMEKYYSENNIEIHSDGTRNGAYFIHVNEGQRPLGSLTEKLRILSDEKRIVLFLKDESYTFTNGRLDSDPPF